MTFPALWRHCKRNNFAKIIFIGFFLVFLIPTSAFSKSQNLKILKKEDSRFVEHFKKIKRLPKEFREKFHRFQKPDKIISRKKSDADSVNLLVLLVDFVEEIDDNPKTTGKGKFDFGNYDYFTVNGELDSVQTIGSPPHDSTYFHQTLVALWHYYHVASLGELNSLNFHFKIFPNQVDTAYHLPNEMAYYNPDTDDWGLKTERFEEYFKNAIASADTTNFPNTPEIIFSDYNHIMLIHAGSDWQHDVFGDTPCDIPAFFISLEDDSIAVNDSTYFVKEAANIPETISQDFYKYKHWQYGFGALNAEMVHEFGHSLGFVDLYNTTNMFPAVGYWDIMDSGGFTAVISKDTTVTLVIEGALPILPSAWSRMLVWGDEFENSGKYCEITFPDSFSIDAAEIINNANPQFIKIPINDKEYFLLENRIPDLNKDGTCEILTDASTRVPLYPTNPESEINNWEYDYMLPTYDLYLSIVYGETVYTNGGLCIWHIDNSIIYDETVEIDGKSYSRFEANVVNGSFANKGVKLVEADGIWDIGNPNSNYVAGTAYEPFFKTKPGTWPQNDTNQFHNYHFGSTTNPNSFSNDDINSLIEIFDISNSNPTMTFKFQYQLYDEVTSIVQEEKFNTENEILCWSDPAVEGFPEAGNLNNIIVLADSSFTLFSLWPNDIIETCKHSFVEQITNPLSNKNNLILFSFKDSVAVLTFNSVPDYSNFNIFGIKLNSEISDSPIALSQEKVLVPTQDSLLIFKIEDNNLIFQKSVAANNPKIAYNPDLQKIVALNQPRSITICDTNFSNIQDFSISSTFGEFYPIIEHNDSSHTQIVYFQDISGSVYKIDSLGVEKIFEASNYDLEEISNISLGDVNNDGWHDIIFTASDKIFAIQKNGAFVSGFPQSPYFSNYSSEISPIIGKSILPENISLFLPTATNWTQAFSEDCEYIPNYSFSVGNCLASPYLNVDDSSSKFYLPVSDSLIKIFSFNNSDILETKIYWNGYKNGSERYACVRNISKGAPAFIASLQVFAYPNPANNGSVKIRVNSANNSNAKVRIYNLAAELLFKDEMEIIADKNNEFKWNIDKISSGIYFAVVKVGNQKKLVKIGIEK